jgi:hypothetical protein
MGMSSLALKGAGIIHGGGSPSNVRGQMQTNNSPANARGHQPQSTVLHGIAPPLATVPNHYSYIMPSVKNAPLNQDPSRNISDGLLKHTQERQTIH